MEKFSSHLCVCQDGDGLADPIESVECLQTQEGFEELDPTSRDTDGDGLHDGEEVGERIERMLGWYRISYYRVSSRPDAVHSDGDGIDDYTEVRGWTVNVTRTPDGEPLRWKQASSETMTVSSDPLEVDTDGDGLSDAVEKTELHTDPRREVTYEATRRHQEEVVDRLANAWNAEHYRDGKPGMVVETARAIGVLAPDESGSRLAELELDDATDDFDFVQPDDGGLAFRALDRTERTDTWLSNEQELRFGGKLDPWDPDTDDDGLTDGQELKWITEVDWGYNSRAQEAVLAASPDWTVSFDSQPWDVDSDGDGYWDGWLGVYGVENSSNVVLYMEHLVDEDPGVQGDEIVSEQVGVHRVRKTTWSRDRQLVPSGMSADIDGDGWTEHSNIHIGELHWRAFDPSQPGDPTDPTVTPDPTLAVEVDYYEHADPTALDVLDDVERNYRLYGMEIEFTVDEELTDDQLQNFETARYVRPGMTINATANISPPTSYSEALTLEEAFHQNDSRLYMFITTNGAANPELIMPDWDGDPEGVASSNGFDGPILGHPEGFGFGILIFTADHTEGPADTHLQKTTVHEIGHIIGAGRSDDNPLTTLDDTEVYSGSDSDPTSEDVGYEGPEAAEWSAMSSGWNPTVNNTPMNGRYVSFSIEELVTIEFNNKDTVED